MRIRDPGWKKVTVRNTDLSPVTMLGAALMFSQLLEIPPGHSPGPPDPAELAVSGGGPASRTPHSQPGEQGEAFVQLQHRLDSAITIVHGGREIEQKIKKKICNLNCRISVDNFNVEGQQIVGALFNAESSFTILVQTAKRWTDNVMYIRQNGKRRIYHERRKDIFVTFPLATVSVPVPVCVCTGTVPYCTDSRCHGI
jgi:hypothetical protein